MNQLLCTLSNEGSDVRCIICGQGFLVYWSRFSRAEQNECRRIIQAELSFHHVAAKDTDADRRIHPREPFHVTEWFGEREIVPAAMLGGDSAANAGDDSR